jgi:hypothetical protein
MESWMLLMMTPFSGVPQPGEPKGPQRLALFFVIGLCVPPTPQRASAVTGIVTVPWIVQRTCALVLAWKLAGKVAAPSLQIRTAPWWARMAHPCGRGRTPQAFVPSARSTRPAVVA